MVENKPQNCEIGIQKLEIKNEQDILTRLETEVNQFEQVCHGKPRTKAINDVFEKDSVFQTFANFIQCTGSSEQLDNI